MQALESGNPVGPEDGIPIVETAVDVGETFGTGRASAAFADASTDSRLGVIYVVHNDGTGVEVARIDAQQGARIGEDHVVGGSRSEEHTSELQSRQYLVCRLLLEKKKKHRYH